MTCQGHTAIKHSNQAHAQTFQQQISRSQHFAWIKSSITQEVLEKVCRVDQVRAGDYSGFKGNMGLQGRQKGGGSCPASSPHTPPLLFPLSAVSSSLITFSLKDMTSSHTPISLSMSPCHYMFLERNMQKQEKHVLESKNIDVAVAGGKGEIKRQLPSHTKMESPLQLCLKLSMLCEK